MINSKKLNHLFFKVYNPMAYRKLAYPKAARKRRVLKKWEKICGDDVMSLILNETPPLSKYKEGYGSRSQETS